MPMEEVTSSASTSSSLSRRFNTGVLCPICGRRLCGEVHIVGDPILLFGAVEQVH